MLEELIPFFAIGMVFGIPIIAILTGHQRRMAEIIHSNQANQYNPEVATLRNEVAELRQIVNQQAITIDNLASFQTRLGPPPQNLQDRIQAGG